MVIIPARAREVDLLAGAGDIDVAFEFVLEVRHLEEGVVVLALHHVLLEQRLPVLYLPHRQVRLHYLREELGVAVIVGVLPVLSLEQLAPDLYLCFEFRVIVELRFLVL